MQAFLDRKVCRHGIPGGSKHRICTLRRPPPQMSQLAGIEPMRLCAAPVRRVCGFPAARTLEPTRGCGFVHAKAQADRLKGNALEVIEPENQAVPCVQSLDLPPDTGRQSRAPNGHPSAPRGASSGPGFGAPRKPTFSSNSSSETCFFARRKRSIGGVRHRSPQPARKRTTSVVALQLSLGRPSRNADAPRPAD